MSAPESPQVVRRETISPLADRSTGRLTYEIAVDASGAVYLSVVDKPLFVSVSPEPVPIARVRSLLAGPLATGEPFTTRLLARPFERRAKQNGLVLAAVLCHEGLLRPVGDAPKMHACVGDWDDWAFVQRGRVAQAEEPAASMAVGERPTCALAKGDAPIAPASGATPPLVTTRDPDLAPPKGARRARNGAMPSLLV
jgi:hypothetical protein